MAVITTLDRLNETLRDDIREMFREKVNPELFSDFVEKKLNQRLRMFEHNNIKPIEAIIIGKKTTDYGSMKEYSRKIKLWKEATEKQKKEFVANSLFSKDGKPKWESGFRKGTEIQPQKDIVTYVYYLIDDKIVSGTLDWKRMRLNRIIPFKRVGFYGKINGSNVDILSNHVELGDNILSIKDLVKLKDYVVSYDEIEQGTSKSFGILKVDVVDIAENKNSKKVVISKEGSNLKDMFAWADKDIPVELGRDRILFVEMFKNRIGMVMITLIGSIPTEQKDVKLNMREVANTDEQW